jgi:hypothetical protein
LVAAQVREEQLISAAIARELAMTFSPSGIGRRRAGFDACERNVKR